MTAALALALVGTVVQAGAATSASWVQASPAQSPPAREFAVMTYDSLRNVTVLFGGGAGNNTYYFTDTWEWNGAAWTQKFPAQSPPGVVGAAMAYDSIRGRSVLFGGAQYNGSPSGTWEWDGTTWTQRFPSVSPPNRVWTAMAFDSKRGRMILFGGQVIGATYDDTWEFDGANWTRMLPASAPAPRYGDAMAYDSVRGKVVLFGGRGLNSRLADTWEWDGTNWTQSSPTTAPYARFWHSMAFDSKQGKTVLFGGDHVRPNALGPIDDTWLWDGSQWTQVLPSASPSPRAEQTMVYDSARERTILFGGSQEAVPPIVFGDTWELTLTTAQSSDQTITFSPLADQTFGEAPFTISATASSNLPVTFTSTGQCSVAGSTVSITGGGSCSITASQPGNANYNPAAPVTRAFNIACFPTPMVFALPEDSTVVPAILTFTDQQPVTGGGCSGSFTLTATFGPSTSTVGSGTFTATTSGKVATGALAGTTVPPAIESTFNATLTLDTATQTGTLKESLATVDGPVAVDATFAKNTAGDYALTGATVTT